MKMPIYALPYDLDTVAMTDDGLTASQKTAVYNQGKKVFQENGLKKHAQYSMFATENNGDALIVIFKAMDALKEQAPDFVRYLSRMDLVRIEESVDVVDYLRDEEEAA